MDFAGGMLSYCATHETDTDYETDI